MIAIGELKEIDRFHDFCFNLLTGETLFFIDGENRALSFGTKDWERRAIEEPTTQTVVRGPKDAFTENIRTNTALVRRRIKSPHLWSERFIIGKQTNTPVVIMYMNNIARQDLIEEVRARLNKINVDSILESGMIEELIEDEPFSIVPTTYITERPDTVAAGLLEGRVAILVDGTPFAIIVPTVFSQFFQVSEDYYDRFTVATFIRIIRFLSLFISTGLLPLYISLITFHHEALPTPFLNNLAEQRERVPFPALLEAIFLMFSFEVLREAGVRMPRVIGPAISIVGGSRPRTSSGRGRFRFRQRRHFSRDGRFNGFYRSRIGYGRCGKNIRLRLIVFSGIVRYVWDCDRYCLDRLAIMQSPVVRHSVFSAVCPFYLC